jgi:hypothetical protein
LLLLLLLWGICLLLLLLLWGIWLLLRLWILDSVISFMENMDEM